MKGDVTGGVTGDVKGDMSGGVTVDAAGFEAVGAGLSEPDQVVLSL